GETAHTGLGLYIVKRVVERYGGDVSVEDNKPKGAVFVVRLRCY
ncbi:histidine kinase, partial [Archaeoglobales archaeon]